MKRTAEFLLQDAAYRFPYHHLPVSSDGVWWPGRGLSWAYEYLALLETVTDLVLEFSPGKVLDFGCGDGRLSLQLVRLGCPEVVGCDISEGAVLLAKALGFATSCRFYPQIEQVCEYDFDAAVAMEVLEHVDDSEVPHVVDAIADRLRSKGRFVVSVPTTNIPLQAKHFRHYTLQVLEEQLGGRFEVDEVRWVHHGGPLANAIRRLVINRMYIANSSLVLRMATRLYNKWVRSSIPEGAHRLVARLVKAE